MSKMPVFIINPAFMPIRNHNHRFTVLVGGSGSGKSYSGTQHVLLRFLTEPGCNVIFARKVAREIRGSCFALVQQILNTLPGHGCKIRTSNMVIDAPNGNRMYFVGLNDREGIKSVTFTNGIAEIIVAEEASQFLKEDIDQLNLRLRGNTGIKKEFHLWLNPINITHWIKIWFFDKKAYDAFLHRSTYKDNLFIDDEYKKILLAYKDNDYYLYTVYALGEWGSLDENNVIIQQRVLLEAANQKIADPAPGGLNIGIDVARFGDDKAVIYYKKGMKVFDPISYDKSSTTLLKDKAIELVTLFRAKHGEKLLCIINVDVTGVGAGVVDQLVEWKKKNKIKRVKINAINFGGKAKDEDKYANTVTEMYFELGETLENEYVDLPYHSDTINEAGTRCYEVDNKSRLKIEPKEIFKKRLAHSPDFADALALCVYVPKMEKNWSDIF